VAEITAPIIEPTLYKKGDFEMSKKLQITQTQKEALDTQVATSIIGFILAGLAVGALQLGKAITEVEVDLAELIPTPD